MEKIRELFYISKYIIIYLKLKIMVNYIKILYIIKVYLKKIHLILFFEFYTGYFYNIINYNIRKNEYFFYPGHLILLRLFLG